MMMKMSNHDIIKQEDVNEFWVSTVAFPLPEIGLGSFETMVFGRDETGKVDYNDRYCDRYDTRDEALAGHERVCAALRAGTLLLYS